MRVCLARDSTAGAKQRQSVIGPTATIANDKSQIANKNEDLDEILKELWPDCEGRPRDIV
jgi:hypothetical protein